jgi:hypothetical protein
VIAFFGSLDEVVATDRRESLYLAVGAAAIQIEIVAVIAFFVCRRKNAVAADGVAVFPVEFADVVDVALAGEFTAARGNDDSWLTDDDWTTDAEGIGIVVHDAVDVI